MLPSALWVASLSGLLGALDTSVNIAFPAITEAFQLDVTMMQWVVVSYVLTYASLLVSCGRLADLLGHTRLLRLGLVLSAVALLGCGVAPSFAWLLVARVGQGLAAALVLGAAPALVTLSVPAEERGRALGIFQMSMAVGVSIGPLLGGVLVDGFGWRAVYLFRIVPSLLLAWFAAQQPPLAQAADTRRWRRRLLAGRESGPRSGLDVTTCCIPFSGGDAEHNRICRHREAGERSGGRPELVPTTRF